MDEFIFPTMDSDIEVKETVLKWKRVATRNPQSRHGHRAVNIKELMIVFGGGNNAIINDLDVYNTATNQWFVPETIGDIPAGRAAFGIAVEGTRIFVFGGMKEYGIYSNVLYELQTTNWQWRKLKTRGFDPCPRLGHTITMINEKIYLFGGMTNESGNPQEIIPEYLNDLYSLDINAARLKWKQPNTFGKPPSPRESHTAVTFTCSKTNCSYLVIYGGMDGFRRLGDLWMLDTVSMIWKIVQTKGVTPLRRSLHSSTLIGHRMYVVGGWVSISIEVDEPKSFFSCEKEWKCTNTVACLNLETMYWEEMLVDSPEKDVPRARTGHCAVGIDSRLYIWSGRDGNGGVWTNLIRVFCSDLWYLEVEVPPTAARVAIVRATTKSLKLKWAATPSTDTYMLEVQKIESGAQPTSSAPPNTVTTVQMAACSSNSLKISLAPTSNSLPTSTSSSFAKMHNSEHKIAVIPKHVVSTNIISHETIPNVQHIPNVSNMNILDYTAKVADDMIYEERIDQMDGADNQLGVLSSDDDTSSNDNSADGHFRDGNATDVVSTEADHTTDTENERIDQDHQDVDSDDGNTSDGSSFVSDMITKTVALYLQKFENNTDTVLRPRHVPTKPTAPFISTKRKGVIRNLRTTYSTSAEQNLSVPDSAQKWNCVGFFRTLSHTVTDYIPHDEWNTSMVDEAITSDSFVDLSKYGRVSLEPRTEYRFRLTAINGCGMGAFGDVSSFKTFQYSVND